MYWFYPEGEIVNKVVDVDRTQRKKNEIIKMNRNYVERRIWTDKYVHEHHAYDKNNAGYVNVGFFPQ